MITAGSPHDSGSLTSSVHSPTRRTSGLSGAPTGQGRQMPRASSSSSFSSPTLPSASNTAVSGGVTCVSSPTLHNGCTVSAFSLTNPSGPSAKRNGSSSSPTANTASPTSASLSKGQGSHAGAGSRKGVSRSCGAVGVMATSSSTASLTNLNEREGKATGKTTSRRAQRRMQQQEHYHQHLQGLLAAETTATALAEDEQTNFDGADQNALQCCTRSEASNGSDTTHGSADHSAGSHSERSGDSAAHDTRAKSFPSSRHRTDIGGAGRGTTVRRRGQDEKDEEDHEKHRNVNRGDHGPVATRGRATKRQTQTRAPLPTPKKPHIHGNSKRIAKKRAAAAAGDADIHDGGESFDDDVSSLSVTAHSVYSTTTSARPASSLSTTSSTLGRRGGSQSSYRSAATERSALLAETPLSQHTSSASVFASPHLQRPHSTHTMTRRLSGAENARADGTSRRTGAASYSPAHRNGAMALYHEQQQVARGRREKRTQRKHERQAGRDEKVEALLLGLPEPALGVGQLSTSGSGESGSEGGNGEDGDGNEGCSTDLPANCSHALTPGDQATVTRECNAQEAGDANEEAGTEETPKSSEDAPAHHQRTGVQGATPSHSLRPPHTGLTAKSRRSVTIVAPTTPPMRTAHHKGFHHGKGPFHHGRGTGGDEEAMSDAATRTPPAPLPILPTAARSPQTDRRAGEATVPGDAFGTGAGSGETVAQGGTSEEEIRDGCRASLPKATSTESMSYVEAALKPPSAQAVMASMVGKRLPMGRTLHSGGGTGTGLFIALPRSPVHTNFAARSSKEQDQPSHQQQPDEEANGKPQQTESAGEGAALQATNATPSTRRYPNYTGAPSASTARGRAALPCNPGPQFFHESIVAHLHQHHNSNGGTNGLNRGSGNSTTDTARGFLTGGFSYGYGSDFSESVGGSPLYPFGSEDDEEALYYNNFPSWYPSDVSPEERQRLRQAHQRRVHAAAALTTSNKAPPRTFCATCGGVIPAIKLSRSFHNLCTQDLSAVEDAEDALEKPSESEGVPQPAEWQGKNEEENEDGEGEAPVHQQQAVSPTSSSSPLSHPGLWNNKETMQVCACPAPVIDRTLQAFSAAEVLPGLYLGSYADASNAHALRHNGISLVLNVAEECLVTEEMKRNTDHIRYLQVPLKDHSDEAIVPFFAPVTLLVHEQLHRRQIYEERKKLGEAAGSADGTPTDADRQRHGASPAAPLPAHHSTIFPNGQVQAAPPQIRTNGNFPLPTACANSVGSPLLSHPHMLCPEVQLPQDGVTRPRSSLPEDAQPTAPPSSGHPSPTATTVSMSNPRAAANASSFSLVEMDESMNPWVVSPSAPPVTVTGQPSLKEGRLETPRTQTPIHSPPVVGSGSKQSHGTFPPPASVAFATAPSGAAVPQSPFTRFSDTATNSTGTLRSISSRPASLSPSPLPTRVPGGTFPPMMAATPLAHATARTEASSEREPPRTAAPPASVHSNPQETSANGIHHQGYTTEATASPNLLPNSSQGVLPPWTPCTPPLPGHSPHTAGPTPHHLVSDKGVVDPRDCGGVLIHCRMGVSRSASFVLAYLILYGPQLARLDERSIVRLFADDVFDTERRAVERMGGSSSYGYNERCPLDAASATGNEASPSWHAEEDGAAEEEMMEGGMLADAPIDTTVTRAQSPELLDVSHGTDSEESTNHHGELDGSTGEHGDSTSEAPSSAAAVLGSRSSTRVFTSSPAPTSTATTDELSKQATDVGTATRSDTALFSTPSGLSQDFLTPLCPTAAAAMNLAVPKTQTTTPSTRDVPKLVKATAATPATPNQQGGEPQTPIRRYQPQGSFVQTSASPTRGVAPCEAPTGVPTGSFASAGSVHSAFLDVNTPHVQTPRERAATSCRACFDLRMRQRALRQLGTPANVNAVVSSFHQYVASTASSSNSVIGALAASTGPSSPLGARARVGLATQQSPTTSGKGGISQGCIAGASDVSSPVNNNSFTNLRVPALTFREAFDYLKAQKSDVNPNIGFVLALRELASGGDFSISSSLS